jgi:hypothetical protein
MPDTDPVIAAFAPVIGALAAPGRHAVTLGGSRAKGRADMLSDYDFRLYADAFRPQASPEWAAFQTLWDAHEARGIRIDGVWSRPIATIDRQLADWLSGTGRPEDLDWAIWGYHLPTDLAHQITIADPDGIVEGWRARLIPYPAPMAQAIAQRWLAFLTYWRDDYHYAGKVARADPVFLAGLSAKLAHAILQVVFALNRVHFPGDGWTLDLAHSLPLQPAHLDARLRKALATSDPAEQRHAFRSIITDITALAATVQE